MMVFIKIIFNGRETIKKPRTVLKIISRKGFSSPAPSKVMLFVTGSCELSSPRAPSSISQGSQSASTIYQL